MIMDEFGDDFTQLWIQPLSLQERREDMQFFVLVMQGSGDIKVTHYIASCLAGIVIQTLISQMCLQTAQQLKTPVDALVAGKQHFKR